MKKETYENATIIITWIAAIIAFIVGLLLMILGFFAPPKGEISASVISGAGTLFIFFSAIFGVSEYTKIQALKIEKVGEETIKKIMKKVKDEENAS